MNGTRLGKFCRGRDRVRRGEALAAVQIKSFLSLPLQKYLSPPLLDIIAELDDVDIKAAYGYDAGSELTSVLSFADDTAIIGKDLDAAQRLIDIAAAGFARYGLKLNAAKTHWLAIVGGRPYYTPEVVPREDSAQTEHNTEVIETENGDEQTTEEVYVRNPDVLELAPIMLNEQPIMPIQQHTVARYLGANFAPIQTFNQNITKSTWSDQFERLIATDLLRKDQKLQMFQQYLAPVLNFTFQVTPRKLISSSWLQQLDLVVRNGIRELLGVGRDVPNDFLYSRRTDGGLAIVKYE